MIFGSILFPNLIFFPLVGSITAIAILFALVECGLCVIDVKCERLRPTPFEEDVDEKNICAVRKLSLSQPAEQNFVFHVDYADPSEIEQIHFAPSTGVYKTPTASDITYIPREIFNAFPNLADFSMLTNISELIEDDFKNALNLTKLNLQDNQLKIIKTGVFSSHPNKILKHPDGDFPLHKLRELILFRNEISEIEANALNSDSLERLHLQFNKLQAIRQGMFAGLPSLNFLVLHNNQIETIEDGALNLPALAHIDLSNNKLTQLSDNSFDKLPSLKEISLDQNNLVHIGQALYRLPSIEEISMTWNEIEDIDLAAFAQLPHLQELQLTHAGAIFATTKEDEAQKRNSSLTRLHLNTNGLSDATELNKLKIFPNLKYLGLSVNAFTNLDVGNNRTLKDVLPSLTSLYISSNEISCENLFGIEKAFEAQGVSILSGRFRHIDSLSDAVRECERGPVNTIWD